MIYSLLLDLNSRTVVSMFFTFPARMRIVRTSQTQSTTPAIDVAHNSHAVDVIGLPVATFTKIPPGSPANRPAAVENFASSARYSSKRLRSETGTSCTLRASREGSCTGAVSSCDFCNGGGDPRREFLCGLQLAFFEVLLTSICAIQIVGSILFTKANSTGHCLYTLIVDTKRAIC